MTKGKGFAPLKGYFVRAKVFGFIVVAIVIFAILYYVYNSFAS
jgi:hypothetical protein